MTSTTAAVQASAASLRFPVRALLILSLGVLVTVTAESLPAGLMPEMAADLGVSPMQIGLLISVWALTVILTSIPLARASRRFDRRLVVGVSLGVFAIANIATAFAPGYGFAVGTRVVAAVAHGVFWAVVIVYATSLLAPSHLGRGLALVTAGGTAATVAGLPAATLLAQAVGWRAAFVVLGAVALIIGVVVVRGMPSYLPERVPASERTGGFWRDPSLPALLAFGASAVLIAVAQFASFTYIRPYLALSAGIGTEWAATILFVYGIAGMAGVTAAGFLADRFPRSSLVAILLAFAAAFALLTFAAGAIAAVIGALLVWGFAIGALFPLLQTTLMRIATERTRTLASAGIVVLFNVGIAVGPWLGGVVGGETAPTMTTAVSASAMLVAALFGVAGVVLSGRRLAAEG
ncbi:MFS transporter [Microbacterium allomyrinae]|uniref:MFS transporter n=1 Tax=Microbacterium allomyrinae TaxID=2830666 RepID=A0A9X1S3G8_9MICO|nr:MFS transporter [Microbacterium allomyrinae]MCC2032502.1 MFS transporter [Microbacterium allomyrinae]